MHTGRILIVLACCLLFILPSLGRDYPVLLDHNSMDIDQLWAEGLISDHEYHTLKALLERPLDINTATASELTALPGIDSLRARQIVALRKSRGSFRQIEALTEVEGISTPLLLSLEPYIVAGQQSSFARSEQKKPLSSRIQSQLIHLQALPNGNRVAQESFPGWQSFLSLSNEWAPYHNRLVITRRQQGKAALNADTGLLQSQGMQNRIDIERFSLWSENKRTPGGWIFGHYNTGFADRLTFDHSGRLHPDGWSVRSPGSVRYDDGKLRLTPSLFGGAYRHSMTSGSQTWYVDVFASHQYLDIYQYDMRYGPDAWNRSLLGDCNTAGQSRQSFSCGADGRWYTSSITEAGNDESTLSYLTLDNGFKETLLGEHVSWQNQHHRAGLIRYDARVDFDLQAPDIRFSPHARYPDEDRLFATGMYYRYEGKRSFSMEVSRSQSDGMAFFSRLEQALPAQWSMQLSARHYNHRYANPFSHGEAARDETLGLAQRNEQGLRTVIRGDRGSLQSRTVMDLWRHPYEQDMQNRWRKAANPVEDAMVQQRWLWSPVRRQRWGLLLQWNNKDLSRNGRTESYQNEDGPGRGEKRKLQWQWQQLWPSITGKFSYTHVWEDVAKFDRRFDRSQKIKTTLQYKANARLDTLFHAAYWFHRIPYTGEYYHDREQPGFTFYTQLIHRPWKQWRWRARVGLLHYRDERPDRFDTYVSVFFATEYRF